MWLKHLQMTGAVLTLCLLVFPALISFKIMGLVPKMSCGGLIDEVVNAVKDMKNDIYFN